MALNGLGLGLQLTATDLASPSFQRAGANLTGMQGKVKAFSAVAIKAFAAVLVAWTLLTGAFAAAKPFGEFNQQIVAVGAVTRATTSQLEALRDAAIEAGIKTQFSPKEAAQGLQELATAGQTAEQAIKTLTPVLDLAAGSLGQLGVGESAAAVVGTLNAYGLSAERAAEVTDKLLKTTQMTNFQARDFGVGLSKAAAAGGAFGQSLDDTLITIGLLRNRNIDASSASTAFREATRRLGSDTAVQNKLMKEGINVFDKSTGKMRALPDILLDIADATKTQTDEERNRLLASTLGARGLLAFAAVQKATYQSATKGALTGRDAIMAMREELGNAGGTAVEFRNKMLDTFEGQKTLLRGTLETLQVVAGEGLAQVLKPIVKTVTDALNSVIVFVRGLSPEMKLFIGRFVAGFAALGAGTAVVYALGIVFGFLASTLMPVVLLISGVALVVGALITSMRQSEFVATSFGESFGRVWQSVASWARVAWKAVKEFFGGIREGFTGEIKQLEPVFLGLQKALDGLATAMGTATDSTTGAGAAGKRIGAIFGKIAGVIIRVLTAAVEVVTGFITTLGKLDGGIKPVTDAFKDVSEEINATLRDLGLLNDAAGQGGSAWQTFGAILAYVFAEAAAVVGVVIRFIGKAIAAIATVIGGVVNIVAGILSGDWSRAWLGAKQVVFGVVKAIMAIVGAMLGAITGAIDRIAKLAGTDLGLEKTVRSALDSAEKATGSALGVTQPGKQTPAKPVDQDPASVFYAKQPGQLSPRELFGLDSAPPPAATASTSPGELREAVIAGASAAAKASPGGVTKATLQIDGDILGELMLKHGRAAANEGGVPVEVGG